MSENTKNSNFSCNQVRERFDLLAAGDLSPEESTRCRKHMAACPECQAAYAEIAVSVSEMQATMQAEIPAQSETVDVWPTVRERITDKERPKILRWLTLEPVRVLAAAGALTVALYLAVTTQMRTEPTVFATTPVYESSTVVVQSAAVGERQARVMGVESQDGETVFLWLE